MPHGRGGGGVSFAAARARSPETAGKRLCAEQRRCRNCARGWVREGNMIHTLCRLRSPERGAPARPNWAAITPKALPCRDRF
jgi:hypothetical protein